MFIPETIHFKINNEDYYLSSYYIWNCKGKIFPRYRPVYALQNDKGDVFDLEIKQECDYKELISFMFKGIKENLADCIINILAKLYTIWS